MRILSESYPQRISSNRTPIVLLYAVIGGIILGARRLLGGIALGMSTYADNLLFARPQSTSNSSVIVTQAAWTVIVGCGMILGGVDCLRHRPIARRVLCWTAIAGMGLWIFSLVNFCFLGSPGQPNSAPYYNPLRNAVSDRAIAMGSLFQGFIVTFGWAALVFIGVRSSRVSAGGDSILAAEHLPAAPSTESAPISSTLQYQSRASASLRAEVPTIAGPFVRKTLFLFALLYGLLSIVPSGFSTHQWYSAIYKPGVMGTRGGPTPPAQSEAAFALRFAVLQAGHTTVMLVLIIGATLGLLRHPAGRWLVLIALAVMMALDVTDLCQLRLPQIYLTAAYDRSYIGLSPWLSRMLAFAVELGRFVRTDALAVIGTIGLQRRAEE